MPCALCCFTSYRRRRQASKRGDAKSDDTSEAAFPTSAPTPLNRSIDRSIESINSCTEWRPGMHSAWAPPPAPGLPAKVKSTSRGRAPFSCSRFRAFLVPCCRPLRAALPACRRVVAVAPLIDGSIGPRRLSAPNASIQSGVGLPCLITMHTKEKRRGRLDMVRPLPSTHSLKGSASGHGPRAVVFWVMCTRVFPSFALFVSFPARSFLRSIIIQYRVAPVPPMQLFFDYPLPPFLFIPLNNPQPPHTMSPGPTHPQ